MVQNEEVDKWYMFKVVDLDYDEWLDKHMECSAIGYLVYKGGRVYICLDCLECLKSEGGALVI